MPAMKRSWLARLAIGLAVVLFVAVAAGIWFVATFDANRYRQVASDWVQREYNRTLAIDGPIELSFIPRLQVRLSGLRLSERARPQATFATLKEAALSAQLLPLLRKQVLIDSVAARGLDVALTRNAKGESNFDDLIAPAEPKTKKQPTASGAPGFGFDVSSVQIDDFRATVRDEVIPLRGEARLHSLSSGRLAPGVESPISLRATLAFTAPAVAGELSGDTRLTFDPASGSAKLAAMKLGYKGDALGAQAIDTQLRGALSYDAAQGMLQAAAIEADVSAALGALKLTGSRLAVERFHYQPSRQALSLSKLQLKLAGARASDPIALALEWPQLEVMGDKLKGSPFTGRLSLAGATSLEGKFESGPPAGSFQAIRLPAFTLAAKGKSGPRQIDANMKSDLLLRPGDAQLSLEPLSLKAQIVEPSLQPLALTLQGMASAGSAGGSWKLEGQLAANNFASDGNVAFGKGPPAVQMQASFDALDLNKLLAHAAKPPPPANADSGETPVDLSGLGAVNGKFALRAGKFTWQQYEVVDARIDASLDGGTLQLSRLSGQAWGGSIEASGTAAAGTNRIGVKLNANDVNVGELLKDAAGSDRLDGTGRVTADLTARGKTVGELRARLSGNAALQLRDGAINGINLARVFRQARATLRQDAVEKSNQTEQTDFTELTASFKIADGVARNDDLQAKSPFLRMSGAGAIDIARERIDYTLRATVTDTSKGQGGADLGALKGVTVPVVLSGPLDAVGWRVQWSAVAAGAIRGRIEDKLRERLDERLGVPAPQPGASAPARPEDRLKERLRGIFR